MGIESIKILNQERREEMRERKKVKAFNDGNITPSKLKLTKEVADFLEKEVDTSDRMEVKELLCTWADNKGGLQDRLSLLFAENNLLPSIAKALRSLDKKQLSEFKKDYLSILPYLAFDFGDTISIAKTFPNLLEKVEDDKRKEFVRMVELLFAPDEEGNSVFCVGNGKKIVKYLETLTANPNVDGLKQVIETSIRHKDGSFTDDKFLLTSAKMVNNRAKLNMTIPDPPKSNFEFEL